MSTRYSLYELAPLIEYVDEIRTNPTDMLKVQFEIKKDPATVIKWCRKNFGNRGDGWDFCGSTRGYKVEIWSSRLITMWKLWQE